MRKLISVIFALGILSSLAACGEEEEQTSTPPTVEGITVEDRSPVQDGEQDPYAVPKNGDITLEIEFSNPDNVEFNTVQINGTTYRAHRFSEDSSSQNLILDLSAGRIPGETLYEIEEIEYIDEEGVKSISVDEDNAYTLFVMRSTPEASFEDVESSEESIEFELSIEDSDDTLDEARLEIVHEDDGVLEGFTETVESGGVTMHEFEGLDSDTVYTLQVVATYETDDPEVSGGLIEDEVIGESSELRTDAKEEPSVTISNESAEETAYTFDLDLSDPSDVIDNDALTVEIINENDNIDPIEKEVGLDELENIRVDGLLNNNSYTLNIYGNYDLDDGEGVRDEVLLDSQEFDTPEKELTDISIDTEDVTEDSLEVNIDATDFYDDAEDVEHMNVFVYDGELEDSDFDPDDDSYIKEAKVTKSSSKFKLSGLHADQNLTVFVVPSYDLGDGDDYHTDKLYSTVVKTPSNDSPDASIEDLELTDSGAEVTLSVDDPDDTILEGSYTYHLYEYDEESGTNEKVASVENSNETTEFIEYEIQTGTTYTVETEWEYDLRDDTDIKTMETSYTVAMIE